MSRAETFKGERSRTVPALSVVMPVHDALPHLDEAVESILAQTFTDFEFVILDDASTDGSSERLRHWAVVDPRIRLLRVEKNLGPVGSSNMVARAASAPFVARMDADDISHPERLARQLELLSDRPEVGMVASLCDMIDGSGRKIRGPDMWRLVRRSPFVPFAHGAIMYRREIFERLGGYREECRYWEDQDLVLRTADITKIAVIPRPLFRVRQWSSTRVMCDQQELEEAVERVYRVTDNFSHGTRWTQVSEDVGDRSRRLDPRVFVALGSVRLWSGANPHLFRRLLAQGALSWNQASAIALVWTAWASASPSSLRLFLRLLFKGRNLVAAPNVRLDEPVIWRPLEAPQSIERGEVAR